MSDEKLGAEQGRWCCETCGTVYAEYINGCPHCWEAGIRSGVRFVGTEQADHARGVGRPMLYALETADGAWIDGDNCVYSEPTEAQDDADSRNEDLDPAQHVRVVPLYRGEPGADTGTTPPPDIVLKALGDWAYQYPDRHLSKEHAKALELVSIYAAEERNPDERTKDTSKFSSGGE